MSGWVRHRREEGRAEEPQLRGAAAADDQPGEGLTLELLHPGLGEDGHFQDLSGVLGEQKALLGQTHAFAGALEQLDAQLAFQRVDLVADGGWVMDRCSAAREKFRQFATSIKHSS